jgi:Mg2+ and Co2+ transporter CorA
MRDYRKISRKVQYLVLKYDQGLDVVKDYDHTNEARRANEQTDSLSTLTQMTTVGTTLYVPLAFVTSVFGMNLRQFGQ